MLPTKINIKMKTTAVQSGLSIEMKLAVIRKGDPTTNRSWLIVRKEDNMVLLHAQ
jgi:hypothetical protein